MKSFHLLISNPERTFYDGQAVSVSGKNKSGAFDILPDHAHFISLLDNQIIAVVDEQNKPQQFEVVRGVLSAKENEVRIFVDL